MHAHAHAWIVAIAIAGLPGCTLVSATRAPSPETGSAACDDYVDQDLDGLTDCDDPDCDGSCTEEEDARCGDGRDNDGDGVSDASDPRCWRFVPPHLERCATVRGSHLDADVEATALVWRGVGQTAPDPRDATHSVFVAPAGTLRISPAATTTGALEGLELHATLRLRSDVPTVIALVPAGELGDATATPTFSHYLRMTIGSSIWLETERAAAADLLAPSDLATASWVEVVLRIADRRLEGSFAIAGAAPLTLPSVPLPAGLTEPVALDALVDAEEFGGPVVPMLAHLSVDRADLPTCGRDEVVPEFEVEYLDVPLAVARGGDDGSIRCALVSDNGVGRAFRAIADGDWSMQDELLESPSTDLSRIGAAIGWSTSEHRFVGVLASGPDGTSLVGITAWASIASDDCTHFEVVPWTGPSVAADLELHARGMHYEVQSDGTHVLRALASRSSAMGIVTFRAPSGGPTALVPSGDDVALGPDADRLFLTGHEMAIERVGARDVLLLSTSEQGITALVPRGTSGRVEELTSPLMTISDVAGTFDRGILFAAPRFLVDSLAPDPATPLTGRVVYGGGTVVGCFGCIASGTALLKAGTP